MGPPLRAVTGTATGSIGTSSSRFEADDAIGWPLHHADGRVQSCELCDHSHVGAGWDVVLLEGEECLLSRRCVDQHRARAVAVALEQDTRRARVGRPTPCEARRGRRSESPHCRGAAPPPGSPPGAPRLLCSWMGLQADYDLWHALQAVDVSSIVPLKKSA
jgi:hypothetical protein